MGDLIFVILHVFIIYSGAFWLLILTLPLHLIFSALSKKSHPNRTRTCPYCAEKVNPEATICLHCQKELTPINGLCYKLGWIAGKYL